MSDLNGPNVNAKTLPVSGQPLILPFRPTRIELVEPAQLAEWETHMRDDVGLQTLGQGNGTPSVSLCGKPEKRDDCDQL